MCLMSVACVEKAFPSGRRSSLRPCSKPKQVSQRILITKGSRRFHRLAAAHRGELQRTRDCDLTSPPCRSHGQARSIVAAASKGVRRSAPAKLLKSFVCTRPWRRLTPSDLCDAPALPRSIPALQGMGRPRSSVSSEATARRHAPGRKSAREVPPPRLAECAKLIAEAISSAPIPCCTPAACKRRSFPGKAWPTRTWDDGSA